MAHRHEPAARWAAADAPKSPRPCDAQPSAASVFSAIRSWMPPKLCFRDGELREEGESIMLISYLLGCEWTGIVKRPHFADCAKHARPWPIAADEALDARHPLVARAWLSRAEQAEGPQLEAMALSLARSMSGRQDPDGLDPSCALGIESSIWGNGGEGAPVCERALALLEMLEIDSACGLARSRAGAPRL